MKRARYVMCWQAYQLTRAKLQVIGAVSKSEACVLLNVSLWKSPAEDREVFNK